jgi:hypothetical protein
MEVYIYDRPWENTYKIVTEKLRKQLQREPTHAEIDDLMNKEVGYGSVDAEAIDILTCSSNNAYLHYEEKLTTINTLITEKFKLKPIFNSQIKKYIENKLDMIIKNYLLKNPISKPELNIIYDRFNTPSKFFNDDHPLNNNGLKISIMDLLYDIYYVNPILIPFPILSMYYLLDDIKKAANAEKINNMEDYKKFEDYWTHKKDYLDRKSQYKKTPRTILLERAYQTRHNIHYVGQYMVYGLLHRALKEKISITLLDYDRNPYRINCILNTHFKSELENYKINYYFPIYDNTEFFKQKVDILQKHGLHHYSEEIGKYELYTQNSLVYASIYFKNKVNIFVYQPGGVIYKLGDKVDGLIGKYLNIANFASEHISANYWQARPRDFVFNQKISITENEDIFKNSENYKKINAEMDVYFNNYIEKYKNINPSANPELIFIYGPIASGKSTYGKKFTNYVSLNKDETSTEIAGYINESNMVNDKVNNLLSKLTEHYPDSLIRVIRKTLHFHEKHQIWLKYVQYGILLLYRLFQWAVNKKLNIINDIGGTDLFPAINVIKFINDQNIKYHYELHAIHANFDVQYINQLSRARIENRYVSKQYLLNQTNNSFANLLVFLQNKEYDNVDVIILDNSVKADNYPVIFSRKSEKINNYCQPKNIDNNEKKFLELWSYICPETGAGEKNINSTPIIVTILIVILIVILIIVFFHQSFNFLHFLRCKIKTVRQNSNAI